MLSYAACSMCMHAGRVPRSARARLGPARHCAPTLTRTHLTHCTSTPHKHTLHKPRAGPLTNPVAVPPIGMVVAPVGRRSAVLSTPFRTTLLLALRAGYRATAPPVLRKAARPCSAPSPPKYSSSLAPVSLKRPALDGPTRPALRVEDSRPCRSHHRDRPSLAL